MMRLAKLTASTAALLLSSTALLAQEAQSQAFRSVFIDVGGTAILVPLDVALEACGLDETTLQTVAQTRFQESGANESQFYAQMESAMGLTGQGGAAGSGDAATQDTAAAGTGTTGAGDASGTMGTEGGTASADAGGATGAAGTTGGAAASTDTATANAGATTGAGAASGTGDTTQTANANMTTDAGNTTTNAGNTTADASGTAAGDASGAAAGTGATDTATADASGAAGQDATATGTGEVQNVEMTAANTTGDAGAMGAANADPFLLLATCQIDLERATELQVDMTRTGQGLGFDAGTLGIQSGVAIQ